MWRWRRPCPHTQPAETQGPNTQEGQTALVQADASSAHAVKLFSKVSRISRFMSLPLALRGKGVSLKVKLSGTFSRDKRRLQNAVNSSACTAWRKPMKACTRSPNTGQGLATMAHSATAGCSYKTFSTSMQ